MKIKSASKKVERIRGGRELQPFDKQAGFCSLQFYLAALKANWSWRKSDEGRKESDVGKNR